MRSEIEKISFSASVRAGKLDYFLGGYVDLLVSQGLQADFCNADCLVARNSCLLHWPPVKPKKNPQTDGVDNTKMGAYRALAQHTYLEYQKGDTAAAAELARVLERVWDKAEDYGGDMALKKTHPDQFEEIDKAMDDFITPLEEYKSKAPEAARVKAAFNAYLEKLKLAD